MTLGERIKMLRQKAGFTQEDLAKEIGYSNKTSISKIENDVLDINQSTIVALARALKTTPSVIMGWEEAEERPTPAVGPAIDSYINSFKSPAERKAAKEIMEILPKLSIDGLYRVYQYVIDSQYVPGCMKSDLTGSDNGLTLLIARDGVPTYMKLKKNDGTDGEENK